MTTNAQARFPLGELVTTPGALAALTEAGQSPQQFVARHQAADWGECCSDDQIANDQALLHGERLISVYRTAINVRIWIITEADRASTCILLPEEY